MRKKELKISKSQRIKIWLIFILVIAFLGIIFLIELNYTNQEEEFSYPNTAENTFQELFKKPSDENDERPAIYQWELKIPKIGVSVPVVPNVDGKYKQGYDQALTGGTAHFVGTALPGAKGNVFIFGHSSSVLGTGEYDKIFARLGELSDGDEITTIFNGVGYKYTVSEKKIVFPKDTSVLDQSSTEELTLMTCWPVGSDAKRLIIKATTE